MNETLYSQLEEIHYKIIIKCFRKEWQVHFRSACRGELYVGTFYTTHPTHAHYPPHTSHPTQVSCSSILFRHLNKTFAVSSKTLCIKKQRKIMIRLNWKAVSFSSNRPSISAVFLPNKQRVAFYRTFSSLCCGLLVVLKTARKVCGVASSGLQFV